MNPLFQPNEVEAVEEKYASNLLYSTMRGAALGLYNQSRNTSLRAPELFYQVVYTLDELKSRTPTDARTYCYYDLWDELLDYLLTNRDEEDKTAISPNVAAIMTAAAAVLIWSQDPMLMSLSNALLSKSSSCQPQYSEEVMSQMCLRFNQADQDALRNYICQYMYSEQLLSEEIDQLLDNLPQDEALMTGELPDSNIRLVEGKKTAFLFAVEAMYNAGWFKDANGKDLRSRDKVIKAFVYRMFGITKFNISQLRNAARQRNKDTSPTDYLQELLDALK